MGPPAQGPDSLDRVMLRSLPMPVSDQRPLKRVEPKCCDFGWIRLRGLEQGHRYCSPQDRASARQTGMASRLSNRQVRRHSRSPFAQASRQSVAACFATALHSRFISRQSFLPARFSSASRADSRPPADPPVESKIGPSSTATDLLPLSCGTPTTTSPVQLSPCPSSAVKLM